MTDLVDTYLATWNETDPAARRALISQHWSEDVTYVDPLVDVEGRTGLDAVIGAVQNQFPGFRFTALGTLDAHHRQARFRWGLGPAGADPLVEGFDVITTDQDGRITSVLGFLDKVPVAA
jgi:SnoaL-like protein